jgi:hypothetical protein
LALRVTEKGAKSWTLRYRHRGRLRRMTLGSTDKRGLADARERARDLLVETSGGADPATETQEGRTAESVADLAGRVLSVEHDLLVRVLARLAAEGEPEAASASMAAALPATGARALHERR